MSVSAHALSPSPRMWDPFQELLAKASEEVAELRQQAACVERRRHTEVEEMRNLVKELKAERELVIGKMRYEFEELVHSQMQPIMKAVKAMRDSEKGDCEAQAAQIARVKQEMLGLKEHLVKVQCSWTTAASTCIGVAEELMDPTPSPSRAKSAKPSE
eukprot:TRINITY_DN51127_c0_g1_i1.p1 TRINITY_DN51127_c0_g1~~TRINITY_DN51127_c0_g1_i1.p1  ORF type:complete len:158 (-),score=39.44 TRINITY_DN51127_c0_g1_i1:45-518(-)